MRIAEVFKFDKNLSYLHVKVLVVFILTNRDGTTFSFEKCKLPKAGFKTERCQVGGRTPVKRFGRFLIQNVKPLSTRRRKGSKRNLVPAIPTSNFF
jgi:hypothetical protein